MLAPQTSTPSPLETLAPQLVEVIHFLDSRGWTPATSSNFSYRLETKTGHFAISVSGLEKGQMQASDFLAVNQDGQSVSSEESAALVLPKANADTLPKKPLKPSAETLLHSLIYRRDPKACTVLHTHSINGTVLSKLYEAQKGIWLKEFEILKAFEGIHTHAHELWLPIFSNAQDMNVLSQHIDERLQKELAPDSRVYGFLLAGHGLYTWGKTPAQAKRHAEAFEFLFDCILKLRSYGYADYS